MFQRESNPYGLRVTGAMLYQLSHEVDVGQFVGFTFRLKNEVTDKYMQRIHEGMKDMRIIAAMTQLYRHFMHAYVFIS